MPLQSSLQALWRQQACQQHVCAVSATYKLGTGQHVDNKQQQSHVKRTAGCGATAICAAASIVGLQPSSEGSFLQPFQQVQQPQQQTNAGSQRLLSVTQSARSYRQLLELLQACDRDQITADFIKTVLFRASRLARSSSAAVKSSSTSSSSSSSGNISGSERLAAQQLVCACLQLLLEVNEQLCGWHLSNCLLSIGVLCGRGGPAAAVMARGTAAVTPAALTGPSAALDSPSSRTPDAPVLHSSVHHHQQQAQQPHQQQPAAAAGVFEQLINPARSSRRDLEALLQATGPQHQLQQLLHLTSSTAIPSAHPQQLVDLLYGLAVLRLRPAPDVLSIVLRSLQDCMERNQPAGHAAVNTAAAAASTRHSFVSGADHHRQPAAGLNAVTAAAAAAKAPSTALTAKQLSQLLWSAATLQLHLPQEWLSSYWAASGSVMPSYSAQDVANTCWAIASLKQQLVGAPGQSGQTLDPETSWSKPPPARLSELLQRVSAMAGSFTGQGVSNTLWGLAVLEITVPLPLLQQLLQRALQRGSSLTPQEFANILWGAARCLHLLEQQQHHHHHHQQLQDMEVWGAMSAASAGQLSVEQGRQQLQQLLQQVGPELSSRLQPRDWSNIMWAAGLVGINPGKALLQSLWRKTPAGFSTSLNPHLSVSPGAYYQGSVCTPSSSSVGGGTAAAAGVQAALLNPTTWSPQALANTLWGCAKLRVVPPSVWLQGFEAAVVAMLPGFSDQQLSNLLWSLGELHHTPSDAWLTLFWQKAAGMPEQLMQAAAAQEQQRWGCGYKAGAAATNTGFVTLLRHQQHVVMVLQACGRLGVMPPVQWLQGACDGLLAAAALLLLAPDLQQQLQQRQAVVADLLHSLSAAVFALTKVSRAISIAHRHSNSTASSGVQRTAHAAATDLLQLLQQAADGQLFQQLPAQDALALLLVLVKLELPVERMHSVSAVLVLRVLQKHKQLSSSQVAQLAMAAAAVAEYGPADRQGLRTSAAGSVCSSFWQQLQHAGQQLPAALSTSSSSSSSSVAAYFTRQLAAALMPHLSTMSAVDLRFSIAAVAKLQASVLQVHAAVVATSSSKGTKSRNSHSRSHSSSHGRQQLRFRQQLTEEFAAFAAASGAAVGARVGDFTPHQRSVVAASLAALGFSPEPLWLEGLLQYSSCELSECSPGDLVRLVQALPVLLSNMQRRQQGQLVLLQLESQIGQQQGQQLLAAITSSSRGPPGRVHASRAHTRQQQQQGFVSSAESQQMLSEWLQDWLSESERRMSRFSSAQLVGLAKGLSRLCRHLGGTLAAPGAGPVWPGTTAALAPTAAGSRSLEALTPTAVAEGEAGAAAAAAAAATGLYVNLQRRQQQQQGIQLLQLPVSWQVAFLDAVAAQLPQLGGPELLLLLSAVRRLGLTPGPVWCAAVADEVAARAAATAEGHVSSHKHAASIPAAPAAAPAGRAFGREAGACWSTSSSSSSRFGAAAIQGGQAACALRAHHVGWLAMHLQHLGYVPPLEQQALLLQHVAAACDVRSELNSAAVAAAAAAGVAGGDAAAGPVEPIARRSSSAVAAAGGRSSVDESGPVAHAAAQAAGSNSRKGEQLQRVSPRQLWQLLLLLAAAGWRVEQGWVQHVQGSAAGFRLKAWLGQRPHHGSWQQVWGVLEQV